MVCRARWCFRGRRGHSEGCSVWWPARHAWSDEDESFLPLARALEQRTGRPVESLWLGNYVSLDDDVRMSDLVHGLTRAWRAAKLPDTVGATDFIVQSTGGLVIRDWMADCRQRTARVMEQYAGKRILTSTATRTW